MSEDRSRALVSQGTKSLSATSRLAERTLAARMERAEQAPATLPVGADASVIDVFPTDFNALQEALDRAPEGSTLRLHEGSYWASEVLRKDVRIQAASSTRPVVTCERWVIAGDLELTGVWLRPAAFDDDGMPVLRVEGEARLDNIEADDGAQIYSADGGRLTITGLHGGRVASVGPSSTTRISDAQVYDLVVHDEGWLEATDVRLAFGAVAGSGGTMRLHRMDIRDGPGVRDEALEFIALEGADLLVEDVTTRSGVSVLAHGERTRVTVRKLRSGGIVRTGREGIMVESNLGGDITIDDAWFVAGLGRRDGESSITVANTHEGVFELDAPSRATRVVPEERKRLVMNRLQEWDKIRPEGWISLARWQVSLLDGEVIRDLWRDGLD